MKKYLVVIAVFSCLLAFSSRAETSSNKNQLRFATISQPLYGFFENNKPAGILFEVLELLNRDLDKPYQHQILPSKRLAKVLDSQQQVCTIVASTYEIKQAYQLLVPIGIDIPAGLIIKKPASAEAYNDLYQLNIAVPLGILFDERFDNDSKLNKVHPPEYDNAIEMLRVNRVNAVAGAIPILQFLARQSGIKPEQLSEAFVFNSNEFYFVCNQHVQGELKTKLVNTMRHVISLGKIKDIVTKYSGPSQHTALLEDIQH